MKDQIVATKVEVSVIINKALAFRNLGKDDVVKLEGSLLEKYVGNATVNSVVSFEYEVKDKVDL